MNTALIALMLVGQCQGPTCSAGAAYGGGFSPAPMMFPQPVYQPVPVRQIAYEQAEPQPEYGWHKIKLGQSTLTVWGYVNGSSITWHPGSDANLKQITAALDHMKAAHAETHKALIRSTEELAKVRAQLTTQAAVEPPPKTADLPPFMTNGVPPSKMDKQEKPRYTASNEKGRIFVQEIVDKQGDDGPKGMHLTIIGTDKERKKVLDDLSHSAELIAAKKDLDLQVQDYKPEEWPIDPELGFPKDGTPTIIAQLSTGTEDRKPGRIVYESKEYPGPAKLAEDLRRVDPNGKKPKPDKPEPALPDAGKLPFGLTTNQAIAIVIVAFLLVPSKKKESTSATQ